MNDNYLSNRKIFLSAPGDLEDYVYVQRISQRISEELYFEIYRYTHNFRIVGDESIINCFEVLKEADHILICLIERYGTELAECYSNDENKDLREQFKRNLDLTLNNEDFTKGITELEFDLSRCLSDKYCFRKNILVLIEETLFNQYLKNSWFRRLIQSLLKPQERKTMEFIDKIMNLNIPYQIIEFIEDKNKNTTKLINLIKDSWGCFSTHFKYNIDELKKLFYSNFPKVLFYEEKNDEISISESLLNNFSNFYPYILDSVKERFNNCENEEEIESFEKSVFFYSFNKSFFTIIYNSEKIDLNVPKQRGTIETIQNQAENLLYYISNLIFLESNQSRTIHRIFGKLNEVCKDILPNVEELVADVILQILFILNSFLISYFLLFDIKRCTNNEFISEVLNRENLQENLSYVFECRNKIILYLCYYKKKDARKTLTSTIENIYRGEVLPILKKLLKNLKPEPFTYKSLKKIVCSFFPFDYFLKKRINEELLREIKKINIDLYKSYLKNPSLSKLIENESSPIENFYLEFLLDLKIRGKDIEEKIGKKSKIMSKIYEIKEKVIKKEKKLIYNSLLPSHYNKEDRSTILMWDNLLGSKEKYTKPLPLLILLLLILRFIFKEYSDQKETHHLDNLTRKLKNLIKLRNKYILSLIKYQNEAKNIAFKRNQYYVNLERLKNNIIDKIENFEIGVDGNT